LRCAYNSGGVPPDVGGTDGGIVFRDRVKVRYVDLAGRLALKAAAPPLLQIRALSKGFPGVQALRDVSLTIAAGEVHCLLGQNGAGKSTLIKILAGAQPPDSGELLWNGEAAELRAPTDALKLGIATIYQELDLIGGLSVEDNIFLGHEPQRLGFSRRRAVRSAARVLLERLGCATISPAAIVETLPPAQQQLVSVARALSYDARLLIMDEPTAVLDRGEVDTLFGIIRELVAGGVAIVYISHRLDEIREIGDVVTVLKDGRTVGERLAARTTPTTAIVELMTGRSVEYPFPPRPAFVDPDPRPTVLRVTGLARTGVFEDVSFEVRAGEIVGLAGLVGSGRSELLETIYGAARASAGNVFVGGAPLRTGSTVAAVARGVGLAPEERKRQALLLDDSVVRNVSLPSLDRYARAGMIDARREFAAAAEVLMSLDVRPSDPRNVVRDLSGGNQQKVVVARWLLRECALLLLDEPTRGVDVGARADLYALVRALAARGIGIVLVSSEIPEVLGLADRVIVLREGRVIDTARAVDLDEARVLDLIMTGHR
jgi:ribose transport system ATP-binding protein